MKKCIIFTLVILLALSGCDFPTDKSSSGTIETAASIEKESAAAIAADREAAFEKQAVKPGPAAGAAESGKEGEAPAVPKPSDVPTIPVTLYYQTGDAMLVPTTRRIAKQEGIARAAVSGLIDNAMNRETLQYYGLYPVIPEGTAILGLTIKNGTALIDFSGKLLEYNSAAAERNIIASLVYTLTEFNTVKEVKILVNGRTVRKMKYASDISGALSRDNVLINSESVNMAGTSAKLDLYVFKAVNDRQYLIPISAEVAREEIGELPGRLVDMLGANYKADQLYSELPKETKLLKSGIKGGTLILDFNEALLSYGGGTAREDGILNQILHSAKQIKGVDKVRILVEGTTPQLPEGSDVSKELPIPAVINDIIDR